MDQIINEHFNSIKKYRNFSLIFTIKPIFLKQDKKLLIYDDQVYVNQNRYII